MKKKFCLGAIFLLRLRKRRYICTVETVRQLKLKAMTRAQIAKKMNELSAQVKTLDEIRATYDDKCNDLCGGYADDFYRVIEEQQEFLNDCMKNLSEAMVDAI